MITLYKGCQIAVQVGEYQLVVDHEIEYVTVDRDGQVRGWTERPCYDEELGLWECYRHAVVYVLARIKNPQPEVYEKLIEVQE